MGTRSNLNDLNEAPVISDQDLGSINENLAHGGMVGTPATDDPDAGDSLTYSITAGNTNNAFVIDPNTGEITVNNSSALDYETTTVFNLTVQVEDTGTLSDTASVTINLNNLNDEPPVIRSEVLPSSPYLPNVTSAPESFDPIKASDPTVNAERMKPARAPGMELANPMLLLLQADSGVKHTSDGPDENVGPVDQPTPEPPPEAPNVPEEVPDTTDDDQGNDVGGAADPVDEGQGNGKTLQPNSRDGKASRKRDIQKKADREAGSHKDREKLTAGALPPIAMGALAAQVICLAEGNSNILSPFSTAGDREQKRRKTA